MEISEPYQPREVRSYAEIGIKGWRLKAYGIRHHDRSPVEPPLIDRASDFAAERLPEAGAGNYGLGFLIVHRAREAHFLLSCYWGGENMLYQQLAMSPLEAGGDFTDRVPADLLACVWELAVIDFERQAWLASILKKPEAPAVEEYMLATLAGDF